VFYFRDIDTVIYLFSFYDNEQTLK